jgi:hypothetical protein
MCDIFTIMEIKFYSFRIILNTLGAKPLVLILFGVMGKTLIDNFVADDYIRTIAMIKSHPESQVLHLRQMIISIMVLLNNYLGIIFVEFSSGLYVSNSIGRSHVALIPILIGL